jgi:predicted SnoaL-like aldol condensation-catalyzing enzyme
VNDQSAKQLVRRFVEDVQGGGRLELLDRYIAPDFTDHDPLPGFTPDRDGVRQLFGALRAAFPDLQVAIHDQVAEGDRVATRKSFTGTHGGEFMGMAPTGNPINFEVIDILRVSDGRITDHWLVGDMLALMQQLAAAPAEPSPVA